MGGDSQEVVVVDGMRPLVPLDVPLGVHARRAHVVVLGVGLHVGEEIRIDSAMHTADNKRHPWHPRPRLSVASKAKAKAKVRGIRGIQAKAVRGIQAKAASVASVASRPRLSMGTA